ncbi:MAG: signal peptidase I [Candidatus Hadarchaeales archaeon]
MKEEGRAAGRKAAFVLVLTLFNYFFLNLFRPGGWMAYLLPSLCWGFLALVALKLFGLSRIRSWFNPKVSLTAACVSILYVLVLLNLGLFTGFGKSPYSFAPLPLLTNALLAFSTLMGMEFSRAYLVKTVGRNRPFLVFGLVTLLYALLGISTARLFQLGDPLAATKFFGVGFLPLLAESLLVTHLALLGGPVASLAYRAPLTIFWWFSPILPRLSWGMEAFLGVMVPTAGFFLINLYTSPFTLRRQGLTREPGGFGGFRKSQARGLVLTSVLCVLMVWVSTGLLGLRVTTVLSGSMSPSLEVGDVVVVREVSPSSVGPGDVIQFGREGEAVIHRVVEVRQEGGNWFFITKGDANSSPDPTPVSSSQLMGKMVLQIPKVGWIVIFVKEATLSLWSFLQEHLAVFLSLPILTISFLLARKYRRGRVGWSRRVPPERWSAPFSLLMLFLAVGGIAYAHWSEPLYVSGTVETGSWGSEIECYGVWSFPCWQVNSWLSEDNRTLNLRYCYTYPCDTVLVVLKIHNMKTVPVFFEGFRYQFSPSSMEDGFHIYEWFFGPYGDGCQQGDCCWWKDHLCGDGCGGLDEKTCCWMSSCCRRPPIQLDPCQSLIAVVELKSCTWSCGFTLSISIEDVCWACLGRA